MAEHFQKEFGDMLLTLPIDKNETALPSPYSLRRKILLKHKKLPDDSTDESVTIQNDDQRQDIDMRTTILNGTLFFKEGNEWTPQFFVLTDHKLIYAEIVSRSQDGEVDEVDEETDSQKSNNESISGDVRY